MKSSISVLSYVLLVVAGIVHAGYALPDDVCINSLTPPTNARGVNRVSRNSDAPLYSLHFSEHIPNGALHAGPDTYRVHVSIDNELLAFDTAKVLVSAQGSCGTGALKFDQQDFIEVRQKEDRCPRLLHTAKKTPMTELPSMLWTPPSCGCVVFKVLVVEDSNIYFTDNDETKNGPLTQTVCVKKRITREHFLEALCKAPDRHRSSQILSNAGFLTRHRLDSKKLDRYGLEMALELRRSDNKICCNKAEHKDKMNCFDNIRRHRIDRFCGDGNPDLNFVTFRSSFMRNREQECCHILGEHRYQCFNVNSDLKSGTDETFLDYSLDDTDPANDLAIFVFPKDSDVLQVIRSVNFGNNLNTEDSAENSEKTAKNSKRNRRNSKEESDGIGGLSSDRDIDPRTSGKHGSQQSSREHVNKPRVPAPDKFKTDDRTLSPAGSRLAPLSSSERKEKPKHAEGKRRGTRLGDLQASSAAAHPRTSGEELKGNKRASGVETKRASQEMVDSTRKMRTESRDEMAGFGGFSSDREVDSRTLGRASSEKKSFRASAERAAPEAFGDNYLDEDQGGSSIEGTLLKFKKQILKLRLKTTCCKAGANAGKFVYSLTSLRARNECGHSGEKYLSRTQLDMGVKTCRDQFRLCCMEKAISGPSMTSGEFRASPYMQFETQGENEPVDDLEENPVDNENTFDEEDVDGKAPEVEGTAQETVAKTILSGDETQVLAPEGELDGPKQFDEIDNGDESVDVLDRAEPTRGKKDQRARVDEEVDAYDERDFGDGVDDKTVADKEEVLYRTKGKNTIRNKAVKGRESKKESGERTGSKISPARGSTNYRRVSQGGSSTRTRGVNSRSSRQRSSRERTSSELRPVYPMYQPRMFIQDRNIGAMDSKEMAAAHGRSFIGTLDSKEMAESYGRQDKLAPVRSGSKKTRRHLRQKK